jgi:hypothetical protein
MDKKTPVPTRNKSIQGPQTKLLTLATRSGRLFWRLSKTVRELVAKLAIGLITNSWLAIKAEKIIKDIPFNNQGR